MVVATLALLLAAPQAALAQTETVLYSFGPTPDGAAPAAPLVMDSKGNLYGTTEGGGANKSSGTIFEISSSGTESVLYSFGASSTDGSTPRAGLVMDSSGNLYGTTSAGGAHGAGTVFEFTPPSTETILYSFKSEKDGGVPYGGVILDSEGNLYGTTLKGGENAGGTAFELTSGVKTILHSFGGAGDGASPAAGLWRDSSGNLYGTTLKGGANDFGTVFEISSSGTESVLHSFTGGSDGAYPSASLIEDSDGNLYGTTTGQSAGSSTVFKVNISSSTETVIYGFTGTEESYSSLYMDSSGNLYGTTKAGGGYSYGSVFEVSPSGTLTTLHSFDKNHVDGYSPEAGLIVDSSGNLYGTTFRGGKHSNGTVFKVVP